MIDNGTQPGINGENIPISCIVHPSRRLRGKFSVPGDKSISHRVAMLAGLASGTTTVRGFLKSEDCINTLKAMEALGARTFETEKGELRIQGTGGNFLEPAGPLDLGNSGTGLRLLSGLAAGQDMDVTLTGDDSLRSRPMKRIREPLTRMGATVTCTGPEETAPVFIHGGGLKGIDYELPVASAQVKSCLLLAGLFANGRTRVMEPAASRDHTEKLFETLGIELTIVGSTITLEGFGPSGPTLKAKDLAVPGDFSSAAFWLAAVAARSGSSVTIQNVGLNPRRVAMLDVLRQAGASVSVKVPRRQNDYVEPTGDITVKGSELKGFTLAGDMIPNLIDEIPVIAVLGALAKGKTVIKDAAELRVKEADRISCMANNLRVMGVQVEETPDGMEIEGGAAVNPSGGVRSYGDHRIAMAMAVLAQFSREPVVIHNVACVDTSYPGFWDDLKELGGHVE